MDIKKKYHFYAAHRNQFLDDKCYNLHGHVYRFCVIVNEKQKETGATILFNDIDKYVNLVIQEFDHACLVHKDDTRLIDAINMLGTKSVIMPFPTSAENVAKYIYDKLLLLGLPILAIKLMETESSTVIYKPQ